MLAPLCYETNFFLAAQLAPQGNQAERSETEQGKSRASVGNASRSNLKREAVRVHTGSPGPFVGAQRQAEAGEGRVVKGHAIR